MTTYTAGDKVRYSDPQDEVEQALVMIVLEDRGDRVLVQLPLDGFGLLPTASYFKTDLTPA